MNRLTLPIGISDFQAIRTRGYYYVDKTSHIERLIDQGQYYFLSRPRRFGKSLLLDTMRELFEGNEPLFRGLHIHDRWDWSATYPVVRLSFDTGYSEPGQLKTNILTQLELLESAHAVEPASAPASDDGASRLMRLLHHLHARTGRQVVVLVDEYDKPILDAIDNPELAERNRNELRDLYGVIKGCAKQVRFVFVTGITMFSKVSLFTVLNNLDNISLVPEFATICGYTESDLDAVFGQELEGLDRSEIRRWYNGYSWRGNDKVYNPYDVLLLLRYREFKAHWFMTGLPNFLYRLMLERQFTPLDMEGLKVREDFVSKFDVRDISAEALLFQTGYLTIAGEHWNRSDLVYDLDYPNFEVRKYLNEGYVDHLFGLGGAAPAHAGQLTDLLAANDFEDFASVLGTIFSGIPYEWHNASDMAGREGWYSSVLYACLQSSGADVRPEESSSLGRSDLVLMHNDQVFVFEFKMAADGKDAGQIAADAISQIQGRGYADKYSGGAKAVHLIGAVFSAETRNLAAIKVECA